MYTDDSAKRPSTRRAGAKARRRWSFAFALVLVTGAFAPLAVLVGAPPAYAGGPEILGAGSSYASVAIDQWVEEINSIDGDDINYSVSSSVIGLNEFAQQQVDFGASEIGYSTGQANETPPAGYAYQYLPDVAGATCMMFNLQSPITGQPITSLDLTTQMILGIFTGTITSWGQLATNGLNPQLAGDNNPIVTVFRTDASGENYILSDYLDTLDPSAWSKYTSTLDFPNGPQALWPFPNGSESHNGYNFSNWNGESGSDNASQYVYANPGSITYVETAYALAHNDPCASVQNLPGDAFVAPSALADAEALLKAQLEPDLEQLLTGVFTDTNPAAYPISAYSYLVTQEGQMNKARGAVLGQFIQFLACQGQQSAEQLGYSPLPPNLVDDDFAGIKRIAGAAPPPASVNASTCNDPYVSLFGGSGPSSPGGGSTGTTGGGHTSGGTTGSNTTSGTTGGGTAGTSTTSGGSTGPSSGNGAKSNTSGGTTHGGTTTGVNGRGTGTGTSGTTPIGSATGGVQGDTAASTDPNIGIDLYRAGGQLASVPRPVTPMVLLAIGLLLVVSLPPLFGWTRSRRRRRAEEMS
jgi:ABC-type phosphate transport system substrate-binding protein